MRKEPSTTTAVARPTIGLSVFEIGSTLREARLRRRLDFRQVEQATKIRTRYLRALEEEDFDALPAETYVRGFLRAYADFLALDGQLYVDEYTSRFVTGESFLPMRPRRSSSSGSRERVDRRLQTNVVLFTLTAILVMTALVIAAWKFSSASTPPAAGPTAAKQRPKARQPVAVATPRRHKARKPRVATANLLVRAARGNCWLEVHVSSAGGKLLYQGTLERGQVQRFVARQLWVNAGSPENLAIKLNGSPISMDTPAPVVVFVTADSITPAQPAR